MKSFKNSFFIPVILGCAFVYGCGGGGGGANPLASVSCTPIPLTANSKLKISVKENGIYLISPDILKQPPFCFDPSGISLSGFKLQNFDPQLKGFVDIPVSFDSQGNIEFYGVGVNRKDYTAPNADYTETNVYWLIPALTSTPQMSFKSNVLGGSVTVPMTVAHQEQNNIYWPDMLFSAGLDHWFWEVLPLTTPTFLGNQYPFTINNYDSQYSSATMKLSIAMESQVNVPHSVYAFASPGFTGNLIWSTTAPFIFTTSITPSLVNGSPNIIQLGNNVTADKVYFDWFELEYPGKALNDQLIFHGNVTSMNPYKLTVNGFSQSNIELFDISNPQNPKRFDNTVQINPFGAGYQITFGDALVPGSNNYIAVTSSQRKSPLNIVPVTTTDLHSFARPFDYLIITHPNFLTNVATLSSYRGSAAGGSHFVQVVTIDDVYDSYSGGIFTPQAIRDFINDAKSKTMSSLQYVLLVGDASLDFKNYRGFGPENFVPTFLIDYSFGQTVSDYWFVQNPSCSLATVSICNPVISLGRLPGKTGIEVDTMVNKIIGYETTNKPFTPSWNKNILFVSGSDSGSTFDSDTNTLASMISGTAPGYQSSKVYYTAFNNTSTMNSSIVYNINNGGALVTNYMGHGSVGFWANCVLGQCINLFFQPSDVANLNNLKMLTFLVTLDCLNGMFAGFGEGQYDPLTAQNIPYSIAETFLKFSGGGSVASFGPTGQGFTTNHMSLATELYKTLFGTNSPRVPVIGDAIKQSEKNLLGLAGSSAQDLETTRIFVLLGDPATQLALP